jgi:hypothetical protein
MKRIHSLTLAFARHIEHATQSYNEHDYILLTSHINTLLLKEKDNTCFFSAIINKMHKDKLCYERLLVELLSKPDYVIDYHPLKSSLQKLLGLNNINKKSCLGMIDESIELLNNKGIDFKNGLIQGLVPKHNLLTLYKYVSINLFLIIKKCLNLTGVDLLLNHLKLMYPIQLHERYIDIVKTTAIFSEFKDNNYLPYP